MKNNHNNIRVQCSYDQPIQLLMDKLSSKSSELYIFWQNYNQLYSLYQQKNVQITRLRQEIQSLRRQKNTPRVMTPPPEDSFMKQRYLNLQKNYQENKLQCQRLKNENNLLRRQNSKFHDQNVQLQSLLNQLREQNNLQRMSIQKILNQLKSAQGQLSTYSRLFQDVQQKQFQIERLSQNQKKLLETISERQQEIQELIQQGKNTRIKCQQLIRQSMQSAHNQVLQSLPNLVNTSKHKYQVVTTHN